MAVPIEPVKQGVLARMPAIPFAALSLLIIFFLYQAVGGAVTFLVMGGMANEENVATARWLTLGGQLLFILIPTFLLARGRGVGNRVFPVRNVRLSEILVTLVGILALQQVLQSYMLLQDQIPLPDSIRDFVDPFKQMIEETYRVLVTAHSGPEFLGVVLVVAVIPALAEELLFRGLIQETLATSVGGLKAAVLTGLVFAAYHLSPFTFVPLAVLGIYFGYLVYRSRGLTLAIVAHFANNFLACLA
ncbi:MAG: CPBP family intramembrane metalloprotease, partial [Ignavibacteria bacterium]|nr:CPBP family intramembrane metalloprotease [Ignavibacteria bacterium]